MKDPNKQLRSLTESVNNLYEQASSEEDLPYPEGSAEPSWWNEDTMGPWPMDGEPIIIPTDNKRGIPTTPTTPGLGWPHILLAVLGLLGTGYTAAQIALMLGIPLFLVLMIIGGFQHESPIGQPKDKNPMGTPLPPKPHQQSPVPWGTPQG